MPLMRDAWPTLVAAAEDQTSGAAEIARRAAEAIAALPRTRLHEGVEVLLRGHPSMAPLWRLATEVLWAPLAHDNAARRFVATLDADDRAAQVMAEAMPSSILTISWSSAVQDAVRRRRPDRVVCMMSDPGGEGGRTADALADAAGTSEVMEDAVALERLPAEAVVAGADAVTSHAVLNKVGTEALARAARNRGVVVYAVAGGSKFVGDMLPVVDPFEAVPLDLFTKVATPDGLLGADEARRHARAKPVHLDLWPLLEELGGTLPSLRTVLPPNSGSPPR
jgi:translation initiation factor 2B subunit (eIF-2B alpha/beta/delta family)